MHQEGKERSWLKYELDGMDPERVQKRYNNAAEVCRCRANCHTKVKVPLLQGICRSYWTLLPEERIYLMQALYTQSAGFEGVVEPRCF
jgi:hypothetical protein